MSSKAEAIPEEETAFRELVRRFAQSEVQPRRAAMDAAGRLDAPLVEALFELGLMEFRCRRSWEGPAQVSP